MYGLRCRCRFALSLFEAFYQIGAQGCEGGRKTAQNAGRNGDDNCKCGNDRVHRDRIDAGHRIRHQMQGRANGNCGERQAEQATSHAQQESLRQGFANNSAGTRANRKANRIFAPLPDSPD